MYKYKRGMVVEAIVLIVAILVAAVVVGIITNAGNNANATPVPPTTGIKRTPLPATITPTPSPIVTAVAQSVFMDCQSISESICENTVTVTSSCCRIRDNWQDRLADICAGRYHPCIDFGGTDPRYCYLDRNEFKLSNDAGDRAGCQTTQVANVPVREPVEVPEGLWFVFYANQDGGDFYLGKDGQTQLVTADVPVKASSPETIMMKVRNNNEKDRFLSYAVDDACFKIIKNGEKVTDSLTIAPNKQPLEPYYLTFERDNSENCKFVGTFAIYPVPGTPKQITLDFTPPV